jgi:sulfide:quinone oxidoreductase
MARVLILGAGFGGIPLAVELRTLLASQEEVVLVDRRDDFVMGLRKTWHILGMSPLAYGTRRLGDLRRRGITVVQGSIESIDPARRSAVVDGQTWEADALVIALGAEHLMDAIPGLATNGVNTWSRDVLEHAKAAIEGFHGGRVVVGITAAPYSCPPAPYELALLLADRLEDRRVEASITVFGPSPLTLPLLGSDGCRPLDQRLADRDIAYLGPRQIAHVEGGRIDFTDGDELGYDLLLAVPPHRVPAVLVEAGVARADGWVAVDGRTLATEWPGVYAIGDCTAIPLATGMALPKSGLFAERQGAAVARRIAEAFDGEEPTTTYDGTGECLIEMGGGEASEIGGSFYADPPSVHLTEPTTAQREEKERFESDRLAHWFGS